MTWLTWQPDLVGRYGVTGQPVTLRQRADTGRALTATGGALRLIGTAARLRHRTPHMRRNYALTGAVAALVKR